MMDNLANFLGVCELSKALTNVFSVLSDHDMTSFIKLNPNTTYITVISITSDFNDELNKVLIDRPNVDTTHLIKIINKLRSGINIPFDFGKS
jgi:hypothetical protein